MSNKEPNSRESHQSLPDVHGNMGGTASAGQQSDGESSVRDKAQGQPPVTFFMGLVFCIIQGLTRGAMYTGQKIA